VGDDDRAARLRGRRRAHGSDQVRSVRRVALHRQPAEIQRSNKQERKGDDLLR
jgi:hypothetical protein